MKKLFNITEETWSLLKDAGTKILNLFWDKDNPGIFSAREIDKDWEKEQRKRYFDKKDTKTYTLAEFILQENFNLEDRITFILEEEKIIIMVKSFFRMFNTLEKQSGIKLIDRFKWKIKPQVVLIKKGTVNFNTDNFFTKFKDIILLDKNRYFLRYYPDSSIIRFSVNGFIALSHDFTCSINQKVPDIVEFSNGGFLTKDNIKKLYDDCTFEIYLKPRTGEFFPPKLYFIVKNLDGNAITIKNRPDYELEDKLNKLFTKEKNNEIIISDIFKESEIYLTKSSIKKIPSEGIKEDEVINPTTIINNCEEKKDSQSINDKTKKANATEIKTKESSNLENPKEVPVMDDRTIAMIFETDRDDKKEEVPVSERPGLPDNIWDLICDPVIEKKEPESSQCKPIPDYIWEQIMSPEPFLSIQEKVGGNSMEPLKVNTVDFNKEGNINLTVHRDIYLKSKP